MPDTGAGQGEWKFFSVLPRADRRLGVTRWAVLVLVLRGLSPAAFAMGSSSGRESGARVWVDRRR